MYYKNRKAAWTAMILMDHLKGIHGVIQLTPLRDGSVKFYAKGLWSVLSWNGSKMTLSPCVSLRQASKPIEGRIVTSSQQFEQRGDRWNACNVQHDTWNPDSHIRTNAFGDICQKPTLEGYDHYGVLNHDRKAHAKLARIEAREAVAQADEGKARRFANIRQQFASGKLR